MRESPRFDETGEEPLKPWRPASSDRERELSLLVDRVPGHLWRLTPTGDPTFFNKRMVDFLGLDVAELDQPGASRLAAMIEKVVHPDDAVRFRETLDECLETGRAFVLRSRLRRLDGTYRWMLSQAEPMRDEVGDIAQWYGFSQDIQDQKDAEELQRLRDQELSLLIEAVPALIGRMSADGLPTFLSKRARRYLGISDDTADWDQPGVSRLAAMIGESIHPEDAPIMAEKLRHSILTGDPYILRYRVRVADGGYRWNEGRIEALCDGSGVIREWYTVSMDVDEEVRAQHALRDSEQQLRRLVDAIPTQIWSATAEGNPTYINKRLAQSLGLGVADLAPGGANPIGQSITAAIHPADAEWVERALRQSFATGEPFLLKYRQRRADGVYRWVTGRGEALRDPQGTIVQWYGVIYDIDDEVQAQDELRRTRERLAISTQAASLAELSASIAHEVNQPLAAIVAYSHACFRWLSADPPNVERAKVVAEQIVSDANAASDVVGRIRALFRRSTDTRSPVQLGGLVAETRSFLVDEATRRRVRLVIEIEDNLPALALDRVQIQQVLINLVRNGMEAMETSNDTRTLKLRVHRTAEVIQVEVSDTGPGVEFPDCIFEPFYTTKQSGMGMGLAICRSIVESHGGRLWVSANEPRGATFIFNLPLEATP